MSNYVQTTFFGPKDSLTPGDPLKTAKGTDIDAELAAISTAIASKSDNTGPTSSFNDLTAPGADRIPFWDHSALEYAWLNPDSSDSGLQISGTNITLNITGLTAVGTLAVGHEFTVWNGTAFRKATLTEVIALINHDSLTGFVANEHIDHTAVTLTAGTGLTGGGDISASRSFALDTTSARNADHSAISITAGSGLTGGGTLEATRTLNVGAGAGISVAADAVAVDFDGQTETDIASLSAGDLLMVWDVSSSAFRKIKHQSIGARVQTAATQTLALDDGNSVFVNASASDYTITVPPNSSVAFPIGTEIGAVCQSTGNIIFAAGVGVTITSINSYKQVKASGGGAYLVKTATNTWSLVGDLEA